MIEFKDVYKTYPNGFTALKGINLQIEQGEFVAIIGLSGAGKSTILRCINRMHDVTKNDPAYCASKTGIIGLTRSIACDYGKYGVRANAVCPTICATPLFNAYIASFPPEEQAEKMKRLGGPGGRPCTREEIARTVLFLACDEASYVSGAAVTVDGGYCIV